MSKTKSRAAAIWLGLLSAAVLAVACSLVINLAFGSPPVGSRDSPAVQAYLWGSGLIWLVLFVALVVCPAAGAFVAAYVRPDDRRYTNLWLALWLALPTLVFAWGARSLLFGLFAAACVAAACWTGGRIGTRAA